MAEWTLRKLCKVIIQARAYRYTIHKRKLTHETFTRRYTLSTLEDRLKTARAEIEHLPANQRRRQREKIARLERQTDQLRMQIESET